MSIPISQFIPPGYSILDCRLFAFITLTISCRSLLACRVSAEKSAHSLIGVPLYITCCFSLTAFNILSLFLIFAILNTACLGVILFRLILFRILCAFWFWMSVSFPRLGKVSSIMSSNNFSAPFSLSLFSFLDPYNANASTFDVVLESLLSCPNFFLFFFFFSVLLL